MVKSNAKARAEKSAAIDQITERLQRSEIAILTEYRGLGVADLQDLRSRLRPLGVEYVVAKNTLTRFAAERAGRTAIIQDLEGPTAIAFGTDPVTTAKGVQDFLRTNKILVLKSGLLGDQRLTPAEIEQLAALPPAEELRARTFGMIVSPLSMTVTILTAPLAGLARLIKARRGQMEEQGGTAAETEGEGNMATVDELVQNLGDLKVLELANLVKRLEEEWGVSAAAVAAPAAAAPAGGGAVAAPVEEKTEFDVVLQSFGEKKIEVIKVVRELTSLGLKEAKDLVEAAPKPVLEGVAKDAANAAADKLKAAGATVDIA